MRPSQLSALAGNLLLPSASALAALVPRAAAPSPWITIDDAGRGTTITPTVTTTNGAASTISPPPDYATKSGTWTLTIAGTATITSPGLAPTATPTGTGKAGAVLVCTNYQQDDAPFCMPQAGSAMYPGRMYYITWDTSYFGDPTTPAQVQIEHSAGPGLTSPPVPGGQGFTTFTFSSDFLSSLGVTSTQVTFSLLFRDKTGLVVDVGPAITVMSDPASPRSTHALLPIIILPAILGAMILFTLGFCVWSYKKNERWPLTARIRNWFGKGTGYGMRQSHSQRMSARMSGQAAQGQRWPGSPGAERKEANVGVELTDRDSWSPTSPGGGRNVFREEVARQEREGR